MSADKEAQESLPRDATKQEILDLINEVDTIPITVWLLTFTGAATQLARFGITATWQNYLQNPRNDPHDPGTLGLGQATATIIQNAYLFFSYLTPVPFALVSDALIGRYKTMLISLALVVVGYVVLLACSVPSSLDHGAGVPGITIAIIFSSLGQGGLSAVMYPFIADQIPDTKPQLKRNKKGKLVITDRKLTIQYVFNAYYWMVNVAALSSIPTTLLERHVGFWAAYLLPTAILIIAIIPVIVLNKRLVKLPPEGNALPQACQIMLIACRSRFKMSAAYPDHQSLHNQRTVPWTKGFVDEIRRALKACRVILCFVIFWLCYNQTSNNIISQAGQMQQHGVPNDFFQALNPIACIIFGPVIQSLVFPLLQRLKRMPGPIMRMTVAFVFIAVGIAYASGLQRLIYSQGPCFEYPLECAAAAGASQTGAAPNTVNVWVQTPLYFILAIGEILGLVALSEYTYSEAPTSLKSMVQALLDFSAAIGAALGLALGPVSRNPYLVIMYSCMAATMALCAVFFWVFLRKADEAYANLDDEATEEANSGNDGGHLPDVGE